MTILRVVKDGSKWWLIKQGRQVIGNYRIKANAISNAFRKARALSPAKVRIYSGDGHMQVESDW